VTDLRPHCVHAAGLTAILPSTSASTLPRMSHPPVPPAKLIRRVGWVVGDERHTEVFAQRGREQWGFIKSLLPSEWNFDGKRVLDFGCGSGRILHPASQDDPTAEFWGCDIDEPSIEWLRRNLSPPLNVLTNAEHPPLPFADEHFDLIWTFSVFTHLTDTWSAWLAELHRLLKPEGILVATVFGPGHDSFEDEPISEDIIGMNVLFPYAPWDRGGPLVVHSRWWLEAHWGRAFEIREFRAGDQQGTPPLYGQSALVLTKRPGPTTAKELARPEEEDPREWNALRQNLASLTREATYLNRCLEVAYASKSWKVTAPLRAIAQSIRGD
jgi:SAM-dependent methyltransferase